MKISDILNTHLHEDAPDLGIDRQILTIQQQLNGIEQRAIPLRQRLAALQAKKAKAQGSQQQQQQQQQTSESVEYKSAVEYPPHVKTWADKAHYLSQIPKAQLTAEQRAAYKKALAQSMYSNMSVSYKRTANVDESVEPSIDYELIKDV